MGPELGDMALPQSSAICRHIARESGIAGNTPAEMALHDMIFEFGKDLMEKKAEIYEEVLQPRFKMFLDKGEEQMGKSVGPFMSGPKLGFGDVSVFHSFQTFEELKPGFLAPWPKLEAFRKSMEELPTISTYLKSPRRTPLTENELGTKPHSGMGGYTYTKPLCQETYATIFDN